MYVLSILAVKPGENILSYFDAVIDSSRYYVIRLRDPTSSSSNHHHRSTLIGIGFRDREPAFDLKNCLNDYVKFINRMDLAAKLAINSCNNNTTNGGVDHQQQQQDDDASTSSCLLEDDDGHNGDYKQASANSSKAGNVRTFLHYLMLPLLDWLHIYARMFVYLLTYCDSIVF